MIDYKYSAANKIRERVKDQDKGDVVQAGLYLLAAVKQFGLAPAGMLYCGLRKDVEWGGWHLPLPGLEKIGESCTVARLEELTAAAQQKALDVFASITSGDIEVRPADEKKCAWCDYRDMCRVERAIEPHELHNSMRFGATARTSAWSPGLAPAKRTVLIERFAWLAEQQGIDASRILAITFTEKAATEIKERLIKRFALRFETDPELRESIERAWVSTIHGFCARLLRENAITAGLSPDFSGAGSACCRSNGARGG